MCRNIRYWDCFAKDKPEQDNSERNTVMSFWAIVATFFVAWLVLIYCFTRVMVLFTVIALVAFFASRYKFLSKTSKEDLDGAGVKLDQE